MMEDDKMSIMKNSFKYLLKRMLMCGQTSLTRSTTCEHIVSMLANNKNVHHPIVVFKL